MLKRIAVALDGSDCAAQALDVALDLAASQRAELFIVSVVDPLPITSVAPPSPSTEIAIRSMEEAAQHMVADAEQRARERGLNASGATPCGAPAYEIPKYAQAVGADAIVMGTHGRSGLQHLLLGSVAELVLRRAQVPVIFVRERAKVIHSC